MKTLAIISQKGGSGKSTLAVHLAAYALKKGLRPALIDLDPQKSAMKWNDRRKEAGAQLEVTTGTPDQLKGFKDLAAKTGVDLLIVDTAPHANDAAAIAADLADAILIPCRPATFDLDAMLSTWGLAQAAGKPAAIILNACRRGKRKITNARAALQAIGATVLEPVIWDWVALEDALIQGFAVHEYEPEGKATEDVSLLYRDVTMLLAIDHRTGLLLQVP